ncbi:hypothetical protein AB0D04_09735 [Streptomyces sp. NPDC048483]|uniref:hypothetical protein n=1 Tax=Streptomyces sp. NPDC048483 TaxID=3154927 RepID=UPI0034471635
MAGGVTPGPLALPGFWCERFVHESLYADAPASWAAMVTHSAARAMHCIGADARRMASGLPDRERQRVLDRVGRHGHVGAMAALHRGEPCGLGLELAGAWVEWSARPVLLLPLVSRTASCCPVKAERPDGFGAPMLPADGFR